MLEIIKEFLTLPLKNKILASPFYAMIFGPVLLLIVGVSFVVILFFSINARDLTRYGIIYQVPFSNIELAPPEPHDCEFTSAPLGEKNCHFERQPTFTDRNGMEYQDWPQSKLLSHVYPQSVRLNWLKVAD